MLTFPNVARCLCVVCALLVTAQFSSLAQTTDNKIPNARLELQRAAKALVEKEHFGMEPVTPAQEAELLKQNHDALKILRAALEMPFETAPYNPDGDVFAVLMKENANYRWLARLLALESRVRTRDGDFEGAAQSGIDTLHMGNLIQNGGAIITHLGGQAMEGIGRTSLSAAVPKLDAPAALRFARQIENWEQKRTSWARILLNDSQIHRRELTNQIAQMFPDEANRKAVITRYDELLQWQIAQAQTPYLLSEARGKGFEEIPDEGDEEDEEDEDGVEHEAPLAPPDPNAIAETLFKLTVTAFDGGRFNFERNRTSNLLLMTQLALRAFETENGRQAKTLDELVPKYLQRVPLDPFNVEEPLQWKERDGKMVLYSIGPDGLDDNGWPGPNHPKTGKPDAYIFATHHGDIVAGTPATS